MDFDAFNLIDPVSGLYEAYKGGLVECRPKRNSFEPGGFCYVIMWNGLHYGTSLRDFDPTF